MAEKEKKIYDKRYNFVVYENSENPI